MKRGGELGSFGDGQVLLVAELPLECQELTGGERRAWLAVLLVLAQ